MARSKTTAKPEDNTKKADSKAISKASADSAELSQRLIEIDHRFGDGLPYDPGRLIDQVRFYLGQSAESMLQAGRHLLVLKEHEPHGNFASALNSIGLAPRTAQRLMQAAFKFSDPKRAALANLGRAKMIELMIEDDEALDALADGGTIADLTLDDIDKMPSSELRKALRKSRQEHADDIESHEKLLISKNKKIDQLSKNKNKSQPWDTRVKEYNIETTRVAADILENIERMHELRDAFATEDFGDENEAANHAMACVYYDATKQVGGKTAQLLEACDEIFGAYADEAMPELEYWADKIGAE